MAEKEDGELTGSQRSSLRANDHGPFTGLRSRDVAFDVVAISLLGSGGESGICFQLSKHKLNIRSLKPY